MIKIQSIQVVIELPKWTANLEFDKEISVNYPKGHQWEGTYSHHKTENELCEALFQNVTGITATDLNPMSPTITLEFRDVELNDEPVDLMKLRIGMKSAEKELNEVLKQFKRQDRRQK